MAHNLTRPPFVDGTRFNQITLFDGTGSKTQNTFDRARFNQITFFDGVRFNQTTLFDGACSKNKYF